MRKVLPLLVLALWPAVAGAQNSVPEQLQEAQDNRRVEEPGLPEEPAKQRRGPVVAQAGDNQPDRLVASERIAAGMVGQFSGDVPLRDFLTGQIETLERQIDRLLAASEQRTTELLNERDRFVTQRFDLSDKAVGAALAAAQKAADKAEEAQALRNIVSNEFRGSLDDLGNLMARRDWAEDQFKNLSDQVNQLRVQLAALENRVTGITSRDSGQGESWSNLGTMTVVGLGIFGAVMTLLAFRRQPIVGVN